ncbi:MAG: phenylalanine--tRNA ligase subunit beta [Candidatus Aminicenantes bacterium]
MKISLDWIKDYVDVQVPLPELMEKLNMIGMLVEDWEEKQEDVILDIETYANRPDTLGHLGVAREIAAALGLNLKKQEWPVAESDKRTSDLVSIQIKDRDLCPRYCGIMVRGIKVSPSPRWLQSRIEAMGLKPVNNVVDVTNYVLFSTSQPIHAFDYDKIGGKKIIIRRAQRGEMLKSLEEQDISLSEEMLVIADEEKPMALAGIIGGGASAVSEDTRDVFIESAYFNPVSVRKTSKKTGVSTEASYRFEREADISFPPQAAIMAASLLTQIGGKATQQVLDVYPRPKKDKTVILRSHRVSELLGLEIEKSFIPKILHPLGFGVREQNKGIWQVKIPTYRVDIEREADLIEEIARFYGYDKIPPQIPPLRKLEPTFSRLKNKKNKLRQLLFHQGFDEFINFSFFDPQKKTLFENSLEPIEIRNPVSSKASLMRTTLLAGLMENVAWNKNRGAESVHAFEMGNIYFWDQGRHKEQVFLAMVSTGYLGYHHWQGKREEADFFHLKGTCELLMFHLRYVPFSFQEKDHPYFQPGYSLALLFKGETAGHIGLLNRDIVEFYSLKDDVWAAELDLAILFGKQPQSFQYIPVAKYPSITRDISFLADRDICYQDIYDEVEKLSLPFLEKFELYDLFSGSSVPKGKVSLSLRFIFRHPERTLRTEEVDKPQEKIIKFLGDKFNFQLREGGKIDN